MSNSSSGNEAETNEENQPAYWVKEQRQKREDDEIINEYLTKIRQQRDIKAANGGISMCEKGVIDNLRLIREQDGKDHSNCTSSNNRASRSYSLDKQLKYMKEGYYGDVDYGDEDFEENYEDEEEEDEKEDDEEKDEDEEEEEEEDDQD